MPPRYAGRMLGRRSVFYVPRGSIVLARCSAVSHEHCVRAQANFTVGQCDKNNTAVLSKAFAAYSHGRLCKPLARVITILSGQRAQLVAMNGRLVNSPYKLCLVHNATQAWSYQACLARQLLRAREAISSTPWVCTAVQVSCFKTSKYANMVRCFVSVACHMAALHLKHITPDHLISSHERPRSHGCS